MTRNLFGMFTLVLLCGAFFVSCADDDAIVPLTDEQIAAVQEAEKQYIYYSLREAQPPYVVPEGILFTYLENVEGRIELWGDFNDWQYPVPLFTGKHGIRYIVLTIPLHAGRYTYRYRVNNAWENDPLQTNIAFDSMNQRISYFELTEDVLFDSVFPRINADGSVTFRYSNVIAEDVFVTTSYYDFEPYRERVPEVAEGVFEYTATYATNDLYYAFMVDEEWITDPMNMSLRVDPNGRRYSYIALPYTPE